ncbi:MAG: prolyl oligopeptidase family serine peptidase [Elusimicrobia bacterium]|nr:prolyl oligopeptidase family serine peptidase [Elusimicrobiota bacterium]
MNNLAVKIIVRVFIYTALIYFVFSIIFFFLYSLPKRYKSPFTPKDFNTDYEEVKLLTQDNIALDAWFIKNPKSLKAIIICHGYPMDKGNVYHLTAFLSKKYNLLYFDFRGMGKSEGFLTSGGYKETLDIEAGLDFLHKRGFKGIGIYGLSMGAATALMVKPGKLKAIVADSPYADLKSVLDDIFSIFGILRHPLLAVMNIYNKIVFGVTTQNVSPLKNIGNLKIPILIIHGDQDSQLPLSGSKKLHEKNPESQLWIIKGADHCETSFVAGDEYDRRVTAFFDKNL